MVTALRPVSALAPSSNRSPTFVDLFAGCGGLSLGLEMAGFRPVFVNELNPHAMESYLVNRRASHPDLDTPTGRSYDIFDLTGPGGELNGLASHLRSSRGVNDLDLVVGGPPCQGFSGIGHRRTFVDVVKQDIPSNHLYREMVKVIAALQPKAFVFENVKGLLFSRWTPAGAAGEIWADVRRAFETLDDYDMRWSLVQAKAYGVPQNRPRVLMVGVRRDLGWLPDRTKVADGLLPEPTAGAPDAIDFLGDLVDPEYAGKAATEFYPSDATTSFEEWFRRDPDTDVVRGRGARLTDHEYSRHSERIVEKFRYMIANGGEIRPEDRTKKFALRMIPPRWGADGPTVTATSLPDDYVHFSQPRILTVREWARMQTFPDWYQFAGKRTTGGRRRAGDPSAGDWSREVPKYTQIGNAVPVWLARQLGLHLRSLID